MAENTEQDDQPVPGDDAGADARDAGLGPADDLETWRPRRGVKTKLLAWFILAVLAACIVVGIVAGVSMLLGWG